MGTTVLLTVAIGALSEAVATDPPLDSRAPDEETTCVLPDAPMVEVKPPLDSRASCEETVGVLPGPPTIDVEPPEISGAPCG